MDNLKKKLILFGVFILLIFISFILGRLEVINKYKLTDVIVASEYLESRTLIKNKDIKHVKVPSSLLNEDMLLNESEVIGKYVGASSIINEGSFCFRDSVDDVSNMNDASLFEVGEDEVVYELFVKNIDVNAAHINNNMFVDLYLTIEKPEIISDLLISNTKICGLYNNNYDDINKEDKRNNLSIISLVIKADMIPILNKAQLVGKLSIVPSNDPYGQKVMSINKEGDIMSFLN